MRYSSIVVLTEDKMQESVVRRYLEALNYRPRVVTFIPLPNGKGSGEQAVRMKFQEEYAKFLQLKNRKQIALIVVIDADMKTVQERFNQLTDNGKLYQEQNIAILIPKRNIETWLAFWRDGETDEERDYKPLFRNEATVIPKDIEAKLKVFANNNPYLLTDDKPDSLNFACEQISRLELLNKAVQDQRSDKD